MRTHAKKIIKIILLVFSLMLLTLLPVSAQDFSDSVQISLAYQFGNLDAGDTDYYGDFVISPDETHIAVRHGEQIEIWNIHQQNLVATIDDKLSVFAWNPASNQLATMTFETDLLIWDAFSGGLLRTYEGVDIFSHGVRSIQWPQPNLITSGSFEYVVWNLMSEELPKSVDCHPYGSKHWWSPNNKHVATIGNSTLIWICNDEFERVTSFEGYGDVAWNPDSSEVATVGLHNTLRVWNISSGEVITTSRAGENTIRSIAWQGEGWRIVTGHQNDEIRIWERMTPDHFWLIGEGRIAGLGQISWLGSQLISISKTNGVQVWNIDRGFE